MRLIDACLEKIEGKRLTVGKPGASIGVMEEVMRLNFLRKSARACVVASLFAMPMAAWSADHQVSALANLTFSPSVVNARVGDTITFTNVGAPAGFHNVRSDGPTTIFRCADGCDGDGGNGAPSSTNWTSTITLTTADTITFYCEVHGSPNGTGMAGTINVTLPVELQSFDVE
jgi:plastocyanin